MMRADTAVAPAERAAVLRALAAAFDDLTPGETGDLLARAEERADDATSLYEFTRSSTGGSTTGRRRTSWSCCGGSPGPTATSTSTRKHLVRRIADLIHVPHSVFIRMKHKAQADLLRSAPPRAPEGEAPA